MGSGSSTSENDDFDRQREVLMRQNAEMARNAAQPNAIQKRQHNDTVDQMSELILNLMQLTNNQNNVRTDGKQIEIDGVIYCIWNYQSDTCINCIYAG